MTQQRNERARNLQRWLMDQGITSMGPQTAMCLLRIAREVRAKLPTAEDPDVKAWAERYADALEEACIVLSLHQAAAIVGLSTLVDAMRESKTE